METVFTSGSQRTWIYAGDPDTDVHTLLGTYAETGNFFRNTLTEKLSYCTLGGNGNNQTWEPVAYTSLVATMISSSIGSIPKANWTESNPSAQNYIQNKPSLATVATSGSYNDLSNKPTIPSGQVQSDWTQTNSGSVDFIKNKPALVFSTPTFASATTSTQLSSTRSAEVVYTFPTSMTSLLVSQALTATLQYADDSGFTTNVVTVNSDVQGCSGILSLTLTGRLQVQGRIPAGKYRRVVLAQTGGATVPTTLSTGQEVLI